MSAPPTSTAEAATGTQRPRSALEDLVLGLEGNLEAHMNDPFTWNADWLCNSIAVVVTFHVTEADVRAYGKIATPEERVFAVIQKEPYRTQLKRIDVEVHDPHLRWRRRRALLNPLLERAAMDTIKDLAALVDKRRKVST